MMTKKSMLALITAFAALAVSSAYAGDKKATDPTAQPADQASQKPISKEEAVKNGMPEAAFKKADTNGDGYLDDQEIKAYNAQNPKK
jgi:ABC-type transporter MlaC component